MSSARVVTLLTRDGRAHTAQVAAVRTWGTVRRLLDESQSDDEVVPLPNVESPALEALLRYAEFEAAGHGSATLAAFSADFVAALNGAALTEALVAADYLDASSVLDVLCGAVADRLRGLSASEIRAELGVDADMPAAEEEAARAQVCWALS